MPAIRKIQKNPHNVVIIALWQSGSRRTMFVMTDGVRRFEFSLSQEDEKWFWLWLGKTDELIKLIWFHVNICYPYFPTKKAVIDEEEINERMVSIDVLAYNICKTLQLDIPAWINYKPKRANFYSKR